MTGKVDPHGIGADGYLSEVEDALLALQVVLAAIKARPLDDSMFPTLWAIIDDARDNAREVEKILQAAS